MLLHMIYVTQEIELESVLSTTEAELWSWFSLDDWDYAIIISNHVKYLIEDDYQLSKLLTGAYKNEWYEIVTPAGSLTVGMAYHS